MRHSRVELAPKVMLAIPFTSNLISVGAVLWVTTQFRFKLLLNRWRNQHGLGLELTVTLPFVGCNVYATLDYTAQSTAKDLE